MAMLSPIVSPAARRGIIACAFATSIWALPQGASADCLGMTLHAHRGAPGAPENSLTSLREAYAQAWDGVETDLQMLRDGVWALHHDYNTGRVVKAGTQRPLSQMTSAEWKNARMVAPAGTNADTSPPFLSDALALAAGYPQKTFNAEIKQVSHSCESLKSLWNFIRTSLPHGNWFVTSGMRPALQCLRQVDYSGYLGYIVFDPRNAKAAGANRFTNWIARTSKAPVLSPNWLEQLVADVGNPVGVHVDLLTLQANPALLQDAAALQVSVFTYSVNGDKQHADVLAFMAKKSGYLPSGAIIDGTPASFCSQLKSKLQN